MGNKIVFFLAIYGSIVFADFNPLDYAGAKRWYPVPKEAFQAPQDLTSCQPIHINLVSRHGSRHLNKTRRIDELLNKVDQAAQEKRLLDSTRDFEKMLQRIKLVENDAALGQLTPQGRNEQRGIGERLFKSFKDLFSKTTENKPIFMTSSAKQRTKDSLDSFAKGLKDATPALAANLKISQAAKSACDTSLRFFDGCNKYQTYYRDEKPWKAKMLKAIWTPETIKPLRNVLDKIFSPEFIEKLDDETKIGIVGNIYDLCALQANLGSRSPTADFCAYFTSADEIKNFAWEEDVSAYFGKAYAGEQNSIAHLVACPLVKDFLDTTEEAIKNPTHAPVANLRFGHAETLMPFMALIGLNNQDKKEDILNPSYQRKFRLDKVSPMATNIQWITYKCGDDYKVLMRYNEVVTPFPIPGCEDKSACEWSKVKEFLSKRACDDATWRTQVCGGITCEL